MEVVRNEEGLTINFTNFTGTIVVKEGPAATPGKALLHAAKAPTTKAITATRPGGASTSPSSGRAIGGARLQAPPPSSAAPSQPALTADYTQPTVLVDATAVDNTPGAPPSPSPTPTPTPTPGGDSVGQKRRADLTQKPASGVSGGMPLGQLDDSVPASQPDTSNADDDEDGGGGAAGAGADDAAPSRPLKRVRGGTDTAPSSPMAGAGSSPKQQLSLSQSVVPTDKLASDIAGGFEVLEVSGTPPSPRWGQTVFPIPGSSDVIVYGGESEPGTPLGDVCQMTLGPNKWAAPDNVAAQPRVWHAAATIPQHSLVLVFGGERDEGTGSPDVVGELMVLDTSILLWYPPVVHGAAPVPRSGHTFTTVGEHVVLFGGIRKRKWLSSLHVLNASTWRWQAPKPDGKEPSPRSYHSATPVDNQIVFFGGNNSTQCFNDVHALVFNTPEDTSSLSWFKPIMSGTPPSPRTGHSAVLVAKDKILVFGGWDPQDEDDARPFDDAFILDVHNWEWTQVFCGPGGAKASPFARTGQSVCVTRLPDDRLGVWMFGGVDATNEARSNTAAFLPLPCHPGHVAAE